MYINKNFKLIYILIFTIILIIGASFAWLNYQLNSSKTNVLKSGSLSLVLD